MDISTIDTSVPRARQLRDEPQSGRYPTRGYQQRQPSLKRGAADPADPNLIVGNTVDTHNDEGGTDLLNGQLTAISTTGAEPRAAVT